MREEIDRIADIDTWLHHKAIEGWLDTRPYTFKEQQILNRTSYFYQCHNKHIDCKILAEAEAMGMNILLSHDNDFKRRLGQKAIEVIIISPSDFFLSLNLPPGTKPLLRPLSSSPLYGKTWWRI
jgi:hypothetical protein